MQARITKWLFIGVMAVVFLVMFSHITHAAPYRDAHAQGNPPIDPPTIIRFASDPATTTVDAAESGETEITLSWATVGMQADQHLEISYWRLNQWLPAIAPDPSTALPNSGEVTVTLYHTLEFEPPTYRLAMVDANNQPVDEWILNIAYDLTPNDEGETEGDATPIPPVIPEVEIEFFNPVQTTIDVAALATNGTLAFGDTTLPVEMTWNINNRLPESNLIFEQLLEDGGVIRADTYRPNLWVPSDGTGVLRPLIPSADGPINLRVRVVDLIGGETLAQMDAVVNITGTGNRPVPSVTPLPTTRPSSSTTPIPGAPAVTSAVVETPAKRGEPLDITWVATSTNAVAIYPLHFDRKTGQWLRYPDEEAYANAQPASGTIQYYVAAEERNPLRFEVIALGLDGVTTASALTNVAEIFCEAPFYGDQESFDGFCGMWQQETQAAYQRFEHGHMVWLNTFDMILVFYDQGGWSAYVDQYTEGDVINVGEAPEGLIAPVRGFGELWMTHKDVQTGLGWGVSIETAYTAPYQFFQSRQDPSLDFIDLGWFDGSIVRLVAPNVMAWLPNGGPAWSIVQQ